MNNRMWRSTGPLRQEAALAFQILAKFTLLPKRMRFLALCLILLCIEALFIPLTSGGAEPSDTGSETSEIKEKRLSVVAAPELVKRARMEITLHKKQLEMEAEIAGFDKAESIEVALADLLKRKAVLEKKLQELTVSSDNSIQQLIDSKVELQNDKRTAEIIGLKVRDRLAILDDWLIFWERENEKISNWMNHSGESSDLPGMRDSIAGLKRIIDEAQQSIDRALTPLLALHRKAGEVEVALYGLSLEVEKAFREDVLFSKLAPHIFSPDFAQQLNSGLWLLTFEQIQAAGAIDYSFLIANRQQIILSLLVFALLSAMLIRCKQWPLQDKLLKKMVRVPLAISALAGLCFFFLSSEGITSIWRALIRAAILLCLLRISHGLFSAHPTRRILTVVIVILLLSNLLMALSLPLPLVRLYVLLVSLVTIGLSLLVIRRLFEISDHTVWLRRLFYVALVMASVVVGLEILGKPDQSVNLFVASLQSLFAILCIWVSFIIINRLVLMIVAAASFQSIQKNADIIHKVLRPIIYVGFGGALSIWILVAWRVFPTFLEALEAIGSFGLSVGNLEVTTKLVTSALLVLYVSYWFSRLIQIIMLQRILPRHNIERGAQLSIARLIHYAIILIGFLLALGALGFSLTSLTILGGAVGIGIGFGLQAIVNNFVSGLILLVERPIKVGDTIAIGDELGEVKELGLRATLIQTFDEAEIVVPNSDLISGRVTNWTLKGRRVRIRVPVGVAYGTEVDQVITILLDCAQENPQVLSTPKPIALFLAFGTNSLDFELRVFTPEFTDKYQVLSELNKAINDEFAHAGIEVPFPQRDLHLKSIEVKTAEWLGCRHTPIQRES